MTKCDPCESLEKCHLLSEVDAAALLQSEQLSHRWKIGKKQMEGDEYTLFLSRKFTTKNFQAAMDYFNQIASIAEREGHHPDFVSEIVTGLYLCYVRRGKN
jgi:4a-hydroxytetrahydrobiopterin dehydratase